MALITQPGIDAPQKPRLDETGRLVVGYGQLTESGEFVIRDSFGGRVTEGGRFVKQPLPIGLEWFFELLWGAQPRPSISYESADVSWSPDATTPTFDATQEPWPLFADTIPGPAGARYSALDETSDQTWLSSEAGPGDAIFDYWQEPPRGAVPRGQILEENVAPAWLASEAGGADAVFPYFVDAQPQNAPSKIIVESADVSWSPDITPPGFDPTQEPWPLSVEPAGPAQPVAPQYDAWDGWVSSEAGGPDAVFDYYVDSPRATLRWPPVEPFVDVSWSPAIAPAFDWFVPAPQPELRRAPVTPPWDGWLGTEVLVAPTFFGSYVDAQRPWRFPVGAEGADVSWSPDRAINVVPVTAGAPGFAAVLDAPLYRSGVGTAERAGSGASDRSKGRGGSGDQQQGRGRAKDDPAGRGHGG